MTNKDTYCSYCGAKFAEQILHPRKCWTCDTVTWKNPIPTVVAVVPILKDGKVGILLGKRNIDPGKGKWDIPGGFMDYGETWERSVSRELNEEMNINLPETEFVLLKAITTPTKYLTLVCQSTWLDINDNPLPEFIPNEEVSEMKIAFEFEELAFESHTEILKERLEALNLLGPYSF